MSDLRTAAQQALEALEGKRYTACGWRADCDKAITALKEALVEDAMQKFTDVNQELMAALGCDHCNHPLYAAIKCRVCGRETEPVEPVAWMNTEDGFCTLDSPVEGIDVMNQWMPLYASPPQPEERNFCPRCGKRNSGVHTCTPPSTEPQCNPHPKAPHGFLRNASHTEDRYVCECEGWEPYEAGYQAGMEAALRAQ